MARKQRETNEQLLRRLLNYSKHGALMQGFIMEGLRIYSEEVIKQGPAHIEKATNGFISGSAWVGCAQEFIDELKARKQY